MLFPMRGATDVILQHHRILRLPRKMTLQNFAQISRKELKRHLKGSSSSGKITIILQFRAIDTYDLTKGLLQQVKSCQITTVSCDRHVRSYERVAFPQAFSGP